MYISCLHYTDISNNRLGLKEGKTKCERILITYLIDGDTKGTQYAKKNIKDKNEKDGR